MQRINVGVGDFALSNKPDIEIVTHSLGSCIGVLIFDQAASVGGLLHLMLPDSNLNKERARRQPGVFADTGIPRLFRNAYDLGAKKGRIKIYVVGGSQVMDEGGHFNIGKRNYAAVRKIFWRNNVLIDKEDVGGRVNRTVGLRISDGRVWMKVNGQEATYL